MCSQGQIPAKISGRNFQQAFLQGSLGHHIMCCRLSLVLSSFHEQFSLEKNNHWLHTFLLIRTQRLICGPNLWTNKTDSTFSKKKEKCTWHFSFITSFNHAVKPAKFNKKWQKSAPYYSLYSVSQSWETFIEQDNLV